MLEGLPSDKIEHCDGDRYGRWRLRSSLITLAVGLGLEASSTSPFDRCVPVSPPVMSPRTKSADLIGLGVLSTPAGAVT